MCNNCQQNNCGCQPEPEFSLCNPLCPPEPCACPILDLSTDCIVLAEDLECSGVEAGTILTEAIQQVDNYFCTAISELYASMNLVNVGTGARIYKGVDGIGRKEIRSITSNGSILITENINDIQLVVPPTNQNNFVRQLVVNPLDLPEAYREQDICDYILALPVNQRTIADTDSKWNIIIGTLPG